MTHLTKKLAVLLLTAFVSLTGITQSILNPNDPVVTYDSLNKPAEPAWGQIGKWVRTVRMWWNSDDYKAYIYKGVAFRLHYPKSYNPTATDGKKYPILIFFHGMGEASPITDNEFHLLWGAQYFGESVKNGTFDGYVLFMQSQGFWGSGHYQYAREIMEYMVQNNKLDPFRVSVNGLSSGGQGTWEMFFNHPTWAHTLIPMSSTAWFYSERATVDKVKFTPIWNVHGELDGSPSPYTANLVRDSMLAAGANFRSWMVPGKGHDTWLETWDHPDFWPMISRTHAANPWPLYGKTEFNPGETINVTIGLAAGYDAYEWRRNGVLISGSSTNTILATQPGVYDARVKKGNWWSDWSLIPVNLRFKDPNQPPVNIRIEAENYSAMSGIQTEPTADVGGGLNVGWQDPGDWLDYIVNVPYAGTYNVNFRVASQYNASQVQVRNASGVILTGITVPNTGYFQTWQTVSGTITLPAGTQTLRVQTARTSGWNFNWWEITNSTGNTGNRAPTANAGTNQSITLPTNSVTLNGSGTDADGSITTYAWTQITGPNTATIATPSNASTAVNGLVEGSYTFRLTVTDNGGATASSDVTITVNPAPPPGSSTRIEAENYSSMQGIQVENCSDVGGGRNVGWQDNGDWMDYSVNMASAGTYTLNFRVASMFTGAQFQLRNASGQVLATMTVPNTGSFQTWQTITAQATLPAGAQTLRIYTSNANGGWNFNWWEITGGTGAPTNTPPTANAGPAQTLTLPTSSTTLNGSGTDADGTISTYAWTQVSGPNTATIATPSAASTTVSGLVQGSYVFRLTVTDNGGATGTSDVTVTVNAAPSGGGTSTRIEAENYTAMFGVQKEACSDVGGGQNIGWQDTGDWMDYSVNVSSAGNYTVNFRVATMFTGPQFQLRNASGQVLATLTVPNTGSFQSWRTITAQVSLPAGQQTLRIHTTNAAGGWNINWWEIVSGGGAPVNQPPVVSAGTNQTITLPTSSTTLNGTATDPDGTIASVQWTKVSGPAGGTFSNPNAVSTTVSGLTQGVYVFRMTATDNGGASASADVTVTVNAAPSGNTLRIEAENYTTMQGIQVENTSDVGGGLNVGWQDTGDWMNYSVNISTAGTFTVNFRVATMFTGPQFQLRNSSGGVLATLNVPNTGSFQTWTTISAQVTLPAGQQTLRIYTTNAAGGWNINWWEIVSSGSGRLMVTAESLQPMALAGATVERATGSFEVYPNPVVNTSQLVINHSFTGNMVVDVISMNGSRVRSFSINKPAAGAFRANLPLDGLQRGTYMLRVNLKDAVLTKKISKQ